MNKKLALFVMFLLISTSLCFAVLSKNDAENILLSSIVHDRIGQVDVYLYDELMPLNENVACAGYTVLTPFNSNWVAFIDEAPAFNDPTSYVLKVKKPGSDEYIEKAVDLIETFNYLIGLRLVHLGIPQSLSAAFTCLPDPDLPEDQDTKLIINGDFKQVPDGKWWIRKVIGWALKNPYSPNDGSKEKVLIVWRKLTGNPVEDNLILDAWFQKNRISTLDWEFDTIYVNGSNNLPNLQKDGDTWKVRLIEEEFMKRMWDNQGV